MDIFPARLKAARKAKRLTQRELAGLVGMDQGHISRLENGGKGVSMEHLQMLAKELGVTVSHLLGEDVHEDSAKYEPKGAQFEVLSDYSSTIGLRELAIDSALVSALKISESEWNALKSLELPHKVTKDGYVQLLITIRAISSINHHELV